MIEVIIIKDSGSLKKGDIKTVTQEFAEIFIERLKIAEYYKKEKTVSDTEVEKENQNIKKNRKRKRK